MIIFIYKKKFSINKVNYSSYIYFALCKNDIFFNNLLFVRIKFILIFYL